MGNVISLAIVLATAAFGAVYPWAYVPLFVVAAGIGAIGARRWRRGWADVRVVAGALALVAVAIAVQLVPLSRGVVAALSPHTVELLSRYDLGFAAGAVSHPLSIDVAATEVALAGILSLGLYLVGASCTLSDRDLRTLPRNLVVFGTIMALGGIFGWTHNNGLVYGFWQPHEGSAANGFGPFVNRNHFGGWMVMAISVGLGAFLGRLETARRHRKRDFRSAVLWLSSAEANGIILMALGLLAMAIALMWTLSRSAIVSFTFALACFAWLIVHRTRETSGKPFLGVTLLALLLAAALGWRGPGRVVSWFGDTRDLVSRWAVWHDGWRVAREYALVGTGIGTYPDAMLFYQTKETQLWMTHAHNDYLQLLAEGGVLVVIPALAAAAALAVAVRRRLQQVRESSYEYWVQAGAAVGLLAIAVQETVEFSLHIPANDFLFATLAVVALAKPDRPGRAAAGRQAERTRPIP